MISLALWTTLAWSLTATDPPAESSYVAFSLSRAEELTRSGVSSREDVAALGQITDLAGFVRDSGSGDLILVGMNCPGRPQLRLADLATAMRSVFLHRAPPLVSIDKTEDTPATGRQLVRFEGGIARTQLGRDMLDADILLKQLALGLVEAQVWGVRSYVDLSAESLERDPRDTAISSRFWFRTDNPALAWREDVFALLELDVAIDTEVLAVSGPEGSVQLAEDVVGETFADDVEQQLENLALDHPVLARTRSILALVAIARGLEQLRLESELSYWLQEYSVPDVETPTSHPVMEARRPLRGRSLELTVSGGFEVDPRAIRLESGELAALREAVLESRPASRPLTWTVPLRGWRVPGVPESDTTAARVRPSDAAFSLDSVVIPSGAAPFSAQARLPSVPAWQPPPFRDFSTARQAAAMPRSMANVGGVMLSGSASVESSDGDLDVDLSDGSFSLVLDGEGARIDPASFDRFITSLWCVSFTEQSPGVSIDPIAPGIDQHMVRYIGRVMNTDLGRCMRVADYKMKQWAVGTEHPGFPGFQSIDELSARFAGTPLGVSRRCWFVPQDLSFRRGGGLLLFSGGRMTLRTEFVDQSRFHGAAPADEEYARFFTEHYDEIAAMPEHQVFAELFEYAKYVQIGTFLRERKVPLLWYLLANVDRVSTEDSPGTVDALVRNSEHRAGVRIEGGVDLTPKGNYVFDASAVEALSQLRATHGANPRSSSAARTERRLRPLPDASSFELDDKQYSIVPPSSLTHGVDRRGIRYHTDVALRNGSLPGLEVVRYFDPHDPSGGEFGRGWRLLIPYQLHVDGQERIEFQGCSLPRQLALEDRLRRRRHLFEWDTDHFSIAGYAPVDDESSHLLGVFLLSNGSFRLADRIGNEFQFDPAGNLTEMILSEEYSMRFETRQVFDELDGRGLVLTVRDPELVEAGGALLPRSLWLSVPEHAESVPLVLDLSGSTIEYRPLEGRNADVRTLAVMTDSSFQLELENGTKVGFDGAGHFTHVMTAKPYPVAVRCGDQAARFEVSLRGIADLCIVGMQVLTGDGNEQQELFDIDYRYDHAARLAAVDKCAVGRPASLDPLELRHGGSGSE